MSTLGTDDRRLRAAVAMNSHLRGLLAVPLGLLELLFAAGNLGWGPFRHDAVFVACALALLVAAWALTRFYDVHYGRVTPSPQRERRTLIAVLLGAPALLVLSLLLSSGAAWSLDLPVNPVAMGLGAWMLLYFIASVGPRVHHVVCFGALLLAGALPVWEPGGGGDAANAGLVLAAIATIVAGLLDHRLLVRTFGPPRATEAEEADVRA